MESLRATYKDEDDEDDEEEMEFTTTTTTTTTTTNNLIPQTPLTPKEEADISDTVSSEQELSETEDEELSEDVQQHHHQQQPQSQQTPITATTTTESDDVDEPTPHKKHKPLSSLTPQSTPTPTTSKKPKKKPKPNNVWTKSTSRKGKKKTKPNNAHQVVAEKSVLISPAPRLLDKTDDTPEMKICLSKVFKAEKVELSEDRLTAGSAKGYRMVRATRGVVKGAWYFEIKVEKLGETGHTRLGWSTEKGDLQAPVGYDGNSFGYRDIDGSKIHKAMREKYGDGGGYVEGDVIGFYINLPDGDLYVPKTPSWVWYKGQKYACPANGKEESNKVVPGSEISFFKNGVCQGVAFKDLFGGCYYPAASMYTLPNQPNCVVKFNFGPEFEFYPEDFGGRPIPTPMYEVAYQAFDTGAGNDEFIEKNLEQNS